MHRILCLIFLFYSLTAWSAPASRVELHRNGIKVDGHFRLLRGGSLQWFRLPEETWDDRMKKYRAMGFNALDIYVAWNQVEAEEGVFNFEKPNLRYFLELARKNNLLVAIRPGPYITNEMDGGGLPAWLIARSTKASLASDGKPNLRTHDPDFIQAVERYWNALNRIIAPYTVDQGGPVALYVVENEYNWFEKYLSVDKMFRIDGEPERPRGQELDTTLYFQALHDIVRSSGITIPIVACPGDGQASAMGDVPDIAPFPNIYEWANAGQPEQIVYDLLSDMHSDNHNGIYQNMPTGSMEVNRSTQEIRRLFMGGADAAFAFNIVGMSQTGRMNALTLAARAGDQPPHWGEPKEKRPDWIGSIFDFTSWDQIVNGFVAPKLGYFSGVVDYDGAISSSGVIRDLFHQFRRDNLYWETVERWLASSEKPERSGSFPGANTELAIAQKNIGVRQDEGMVHYWHKGEDNTAFVSLLNQSGQAQTIGLGAIQFRGEKLPKYAEILVPLAQDARSFYAQIMNFNLPLGRGFTLDYSTSEVLTVRPFNQDQLLILYGPNQSLGEIKIHSEGLRIVQADPGFQLRDAQSTSFTFTYPHLHGNLLILENSQGQRLRVVTSDPVRAGSFWFFKHKGEDLVVAGPDFAEQKGEQLIFDFDDRPGETWWMRTQKTSRTPRPTVPDWPALPALQDVRITTEPRADKNIIRWEGDPQALEHFGIYQGHAFYKATFEIPNLQKIKDEQLYVESASDIVGISINDRYLTTVAPVGTEIDNQSRSAAYRFGSIKPFLQQGTNTIRFRTEIWGHGSFMFGRGHLPLMKAKLPALGYDGLKGLYGSARIAGIPLTHWQLRAGLEGERLGFIDPQWDDSAWTPSAPEQSLGKGEIRWLRARLDPASFPDPEDFAAPLVLQLKGVNSKATIYLNGQVLGRWLSDTGWLEQGSWIRPQIGMWTSLDPNDLPIPLELLQRKGPNVLAIAFEDTSSDKNPAGVIKTLGLRYNREGSRWDGSGWTLVPGQRHRVRYEVSP